MTYSLGIDLGTTFTAAAIFENGRASMVDLSANTASIPSVVFLAEDGTYLVGDAATRRSLMDPTRASRQFKRRFGDTTPIFLGGTPLSADQLSAQLLKSVVEFVARQRGSEPDHITVTHPANWGGYKLELLEQSIRAAGLDGANTVTEPEAAVLHYSQQARVPAGALVAVFDLGGGTFDAAIIRKTEAGTEFLGRPEGIERLGGLDFDQAIYAFVAEHLNGALDELDVDDPTTRSALERVRAECTAAKEALSADEVAEIPVLLPTVQTTVRITRSEFENLIRPALAQAIEALRRALKSADLDPTALDAVLLAGGSSRIPLVAEMVGGTLARPVAVDAHPKHVVALGAALAATQDSDRGATAPIAAVGTVAASATAAEPTEALDATPLSLADTPTTAVDAQPVAPTEPIAVIAPLVSPGSEQDEAPASSKRAILIAAGVVGALVVGAGAFFALGGGSDADTSPTTPVVTDAAAVTEVPATVSQVTITLTSVFDTSVSFNWDAAFDALGPVTYDVLRDGAPVATGITDTSFSESGLTPSAMHSYTVVARDGSSNDSVSDPVAVQMAASASTEELVPFGSTWNYLDDDVEQSGWTEAAFDDSTWSSGPAQLGYGDDDEATLIQFGPDQDNKYTTSWFRGTFNVADPIGVGELQMSMIRDDGAVVYVNGVEVFRDNMPAGVIDPATFALAAVGPEDEPTLVLFTVPSSALVAGDNVVAVEIHQSDLTSSDLSFDLLVEAEVASTEPPDTLAP